MASPRLSGGSVTLSSLLLILGFPLVAIGQYKLSSGASTFNWFGMPIQFGLGIALVVIGLTFHLVGLFDKEETGDDNNDLDHDETRRGEEILLELKSLSSQTESLHPLGFKRIGHDSKRDESSATVVARENLAYIAERCTKCLDALAMKCGREQALRKRMLTEKEESKICSSPWSEVLRYKPHQLELMCQEAAYIVLEVCPWDDRAVSSALSLLALVASDDEVRSRNIRAADLYGLDVPIRAMRSALERAKNEDEPAEDKERVSAELQRKGCLLLGALSNDDKEIATKVVDEVGLVAVFDAIDWFRFHEEVGNWALWAVFVLCYDHLGNKGELIKIGGLDRICRVMKNIPKSREVARHGMAILFDVMRETPGHVNGSSQIRMVALNAGMHDVVKRAIDEFPDSKEIVMMGQQMLVATGYEGQIPTGFMRM